LSAEVTLTIDGREITVPEGTLVIRAAERLGIYVPRFCDHPMLDPLGACRQCLVEVEGQRKPLTSCTTTCTEGMVVKTQATSEIAQDGQRGVLELLLINHPLDCPMCDKGGECPLQDQALAYGPGGSRYVDAKRRFTKPIPISEQIKLDRERCVLCARCTRFADQISGDPFIELFERGALEQVSISEDEPYESIFSGNVVQICPVGALTATDYRFRARPFDVVTTSSTCTRCASGCAIDVQTRRGELVRVLAREDRAVNDAWICDKGRWGTGFVAHADRVTEPLVRKGDDFVAVSWTEALDAIAERLRAANGNGGRTAVLAGRHLADEDAFALSRFARTVLGTNEVDTLRPAPSEEETPVLAALPRTETATYADVDAARAIIVAGIDLHQDAPIVYLRARKAARERGTHIIEVGPRRTRLAGAWLPCAPGGEAAVLSALAAELSGAAGAAVVLTGERLAASPGALTAAWNLAIELQGRFGWIPRASGVRGAIEAGLHPALLPGGVRADAVAAAVAAAEAVWGPLPSGAGGGLRSMAAASPEVLFLAGADPVTAVPDASLGSRAIDGAGFVVALDMFLTASSRMADVVLPAASSFERDGTVTTWEGTRASLRGSIPPPGLADTTATILRHVAEAFGRGFPDERTLAREMAALRAERGPAVALDPWAAGAPGKDTRLVVVDDLIDQGTLMAGSDLLAHTAPGPRIGLSPASARARGVSDGARIRARARLGAVAGPAVVDEGIADGCVLVPSNQAGMDVRALLSLDDPFPVVEIEPESGA